MSLGCGLGRLYDIVPTVIPIDLDNEQGGDQISLRDANGADIVFITGDGAAGRDITFTLKRHVDMADTSGTTLALGSATALRTYYHKRGDSTVVGDGTWTKATWFDADGAAIVVDDTEGEDSRLIVIPLEAGDLGDGYSSFSISAVVAGGSGAKLGAGFVILRDLQVKRTPANLNDATV